MVNWEYAGADNRQMNAKEVIRNFFTMRAFQEICGEVVLDRRWPNHLSSVSLVPSFSWGAVPNILRGGGL